MQKIPPGRTEDADIRAWEIQPAENPRHFAIFQKFLKARSLRAAWCLATGEDERTARAPGHVQRVAATWQWQRRKDAFLKWQAEEEAAALAAARLASRARRLARIGRASALLGGRLETMDEKDVKKMPARHVIESLLKIHEHERLELRDRPEDDASRIGEDLGALPAIEDRIPPPEPDLNSE